MELGSGDITSLSFWSILPGFQGFAVMFDFSITKHQTSLIYLTLYSYLGTATLGKRDDQMTPTLRPGKPPQRRRFLIR